MGATDEGACYIRTSILPYRLSINYVPTPAKHFYTPEYCVSIYFSISGKVLFGGGGVVGFC